MFGYTIISKNRLAELEKSEMRIQTMHLVYRWFAGWRDLDIIWNYVFGLSPETINSTRERYAKARGTDVYGKPT